MLRERARTYLNNTSLEEVAAVDDLPEYEEAVKTVLDWLEDLELQLQEAQDEILELETSRYDG
jgi:hypothetical protein